MKAPCNRQTSITEGRHWNIWRPPKRRMLLINWPTNCHCYFHSMQSTSSSSSFSLSPMSPFYDFKNTTRGQEKKRHFYPSLQVVEVEIFSCSKSSTLSLKVKVDLFQFVAKLECSGSQSLATCGWEQLPVTDLHLNLHHLHPSRFQTKPSLNLHLNQHNLSFSGKLTPLPP